MVGMYLITRIPGMVRGGVHTAAETRRRRDGDTASRSAEGKDLARSRPHEMVHAKSITDEEEGKQAKALMVIETGFLRGCQLAPQETRPLWRPLCQTGAQHQSV